MVRRSHHGGVGFPIHVQKVVKSTKDGNKNVCELQSCRDEMEIVRSRCIVTFNKLTNKLECRCRLNRCFACIRQWLYGICTKLVR